MRRSRYTWSFLLAVLLLTITALAAYRQISADALWASDAEPRWVDDSAGIALARVMPLPDFSLVAARDSAWRREFARHYSLAELRARGDGRRTPRQQMQDRVFAHQKTGNRGAAIRELERWVAANPRDADALLSLARMLNAAGRTGESVRRYRQALAATRSR